jgi:hypothetical protein
MVVRGDRLLGVASPRRITVASTGGLVVLRGADAALPISFDSVHPATWKRLEDWRIVQDVRLCQMFFHDS